MGIDASTSPYDKIPSADNASFTMVARASMVLTALIFLSVFGRNFIRPTPNFFPTILWGRVPVDEESPQAYYERGERLMLSGSFCDVQKGLPLLEISANRGYSKAACELAAYYRWVHPNDVNLARWMKPCAEQ